MIDAELISLLKKQSDSSFKKGLIEMPVKIIPIITQLDVSNKFIIRYFSRYVNDKLTVVEIDKRQYDSFKKNPRFMVTSIRWKIVGKQDTQYLLSGIPIYGVAELNRIAVAEVDLTFGGLRSYITNYLEFWIAEE